MGMGMGFVLHCIALAQPGEDGVEGAGYSSQHPLFHSYSAEHEP